MFSMARITISPLIHLLRLFHFLKLPLFGVSINFFLSSLVILIIFTDPLVRLLLSAPIIKVHRSLTSFLKTTYMKTLPILFLRRRISLPLSLSTLVLLTIALFTCCAPARTTVKAISNSENTTISVSISGNTSGGTSIVDVRPSLDSNQVIIKPYVP